MHIILCTLQQQYRVKIINPDKRSDFIVRELHGFHTLFDSITSMSPLQPISKGVTLQSSKHWLMCRADLEQMNKSLGKSNLVV